MKLICQLPEKKFYRPIAPTEQWYRWEDKAQPKIRLMCKSIDPWQYEEVVVLLHLALSKSDRSQYPTALNLKIFPNIEPGLRKGKIVREFFKSTFAHSQADGILFFAAFPAEKDSEIPHWLSYTLLAEPETIEQIIDWKVKTDDLENVVKRLQKILQKYK